MVALLHCARCREADGHLYELGGGEGWISVGEPGGSNGYRVSPPAWKVELAPLRLGWARAVLR